MEDIGVGRITLAHPAIMQIVCEETNIPIEVSTIMEVKHAAQLRRLKELYPNINKVCISLEINRNINQVADLYEFCFNEGIILEVLATEFCKTGRSNCVHRRHCYDQHSHNMSHEAARKGINDDGTKQQKSLRGYPWNGKTGCIYSRAEDISWLIGNTIWPQHLFRYSAETGVRNFKITTRTAPPEYGKWLTETYMKGHFTGYIASLWLQLQASSAYAMKHDFKKMQERGMPEYSINQLLVNRGITTRVNGKAYTGTDFMSIYFDNPDVDWSQIVWVDKATASLKKYECNWGDQWIRILDNE